VLVLDMVEIFPPLEKYKYDTWRILLVKCYIDNFMRLRSCIRNINTCLPSHKHHLGGGWPYLRHRCMPSAKAESVKTVPSGLENRILQFSLKLQIVLQLDQAQTVRASQDVAPWSSSLKYSYVRTSTKKCINTRIDSKGTRRGLL
jgi:hypothetical protein